MAGQPFLALHHTAQAVASPGQSGFDGIFTHAQGIGHLSGFLALPVVENKNVLVLLVQIVQTLKNELLGFGQYEMVQLTVMGIRGLVLIAIAVCTSAPVDKFLRVKVPQMGRSIEQEEEELERKRKAQLSYAEKHEKRLIILETFLRGLPTVSLRQS